MSTEKRAQVVAQCKVVAHLATALARVHMDYEKIFAEHGAESVIEQVGRRSANIMETLGDILNGMDAVTDEDKWTDEVFIDARRVWPKEGG